MQPNLLISEKVNEGVWLLVHIYRHGPPISHLFFANDCLLFTKAKASQVRLINEVLQAFCLTSGLKVNWEKSKFMASGNML